MVGYVNEMGSPRNESLGIPSLTEVTQGQPTSTIHDRTFRSVPPYNALEKFSRACNGTTGSTYSARVFRPVMSSFIRVPFAHGIKRQNHKAIGEWHGVKRTGNPSESHFLC